MCTICTCGLDDDDDEDIKGDLCDDSSITGDDDWDDEEAVGYFEPASAQQCSECGGLVCADLNEIKYGTDSKGNTLYECPHCGAINLEFGSE